jgi:hypothetical protein
MVLLAAPEVAFRATLGERVSVGVREGRNQRFDPKETKRRVSSKIAISAL